MPKKEYVKEGVSAEKVEEKKPNLFDHELIPKHRILTNEEEIKLLSKYNITKINLPKISRKDPASKLIKAKPGDILEIERRSETAGVTKYYRVVVQD